jgi:hypothetical protein
MIVPGIRPIFILKISLALAISLFVLIIIESRGHPFDYFNTRCRDYRQKDFSRRLNDRIADYSDNAKLKGAGISRDDRELREKISGGKLVKVKTGELYIVEKMTYSYPAVTADSKVLLEEISRRFREKTSQKGLNGSRIYITSMTRKTDNLKSLRRNNRNSSENSPHLYGNAFDISYKRFSVRKMVLTNCDKKYLKESLAEVICQLRDEKRCWATYERMQNCFHVVTR